MRKQVKQPIPAAAVAPKTGQTIISAVLLGEPQSGRSALNQALKQAVKMPKLGAKRGEETKIEAEEPIATNRYREGQEIKYGQEQSLLKGRKYDVALVCVDLSKPIDSDDLSVRLHEIEVHSKNQDIKVVIVGTKNDTREADAPVHDEKLRKIANQNGIDYVSCSKDDLKSVLNVTETVKRAVAAPKAEAVAEVQDSNEEKLALHQRILRKIHGAESTLSFTISGSDLVGEKHAHLQIIPTGDDKQPASQYTTFEKDYFRPGKDFKVLHESITTKSGSTIEASTSEKKPGVVNVEVTVRKKGIEEAADVIEKIVRNNPETVVRLNHGSDKNSNLAQKFIEALASRGINLKSEGSEYTPARPGK